MLHLASTLGDDLEGHLPTVGQASLPVMTAWKAIFHFTQERRTLILLRRTPVAHGLFARVLFRCRAI